MSDASLNSLVRHLRRAVGHDQTGGLADAELLDRFLSTRDEAAFEVLVWRHGPMVLGTCRRVLHHEQDVEDAFQATFLALVRKGRGIGRREAFSGWLYRVAYHVALRARSDAARRTAVESVAPTGSCTDDEILTRELRAALDDEINRLPSRYRLPLILHYLQGKSLEEIGRELGSPPATVGTWLARGRDRLRGRLLRRGLALSTTALLAALASATAAAVPGSLAGQTIYLLCRHLANAPAPVLSGRVYSLANGALDAMTISHAKWALTALLALCLSGLAGEQLLHHAQADEKAPAQKPSTEPQPVLLRWRFTKDKPFYQTMETTSEQTTRTLGEDTRQTQKQVTYWRWTPTTDPAAPGDLILTEKVEGIAMNVDVGGNIVGYDSTADSPVTSPLAEFYKALVGSEFTIVLGPDRQVKEARGGSKLVEKVGAANPQIASLSSGVVSDTSLKYSAQLGLAALPSVGVKPGDSWVQRTSAIVTGNGGTFDLTWKYTYQGMQGNLDRVTIDGILSSAEPSEIGKQAVPYTVKRCQIKKQKVDGVLLFDRTHGYVARQELHIQLEAELDVALGAQTTPVILKTDQTTVTVTSDTPQLDKQASEVERLKRENAKLRKQLQAIEEILKRG